MGMAKGKKKEKYFCTDCGHETIGYMGKCPGCGAWNTMAPAPSASGRTERSGQKGRNWASGPKAPPTPLEDVEGEQEDRLSTGIEEFDFVLGGGLVPGSFVLLGGAPGVGKSTILTQVAARLHARGHSAIYVSGEESAHQVKLRAERLGDGALKIPFLAETDVGDVLSHAVEATPDVLVIDSIQTLHDSSVDGVPGGVKQLRHTAAELLRFAKERGVAIFIIGHVTKKGSLAGPRILEHMVDTVIYFEHAGNLDHRVMRAVKNRYGSEKEIGVFRMTAQGLEPVPNPSEVFLADRDAGNPGSAVTAVMEGSRPLLVETQGLVSVTAYGSPQRVATGFSRKRLSILLAVLEKRAGIPFGQLDVFLNVVGGLKLDEPSADAAVAMALVSSVANRPVPTDAVILGELGLGGELRRVSRLEDRLREAAGLGFGRVYTAARAIPDRTPDGLEVVGVADVSRLVNELFGNLKMNVGAGEGQGGRPEGKRTKNGNRVRLELE